MLRDAAWCCVVLRGSVMRVEVNGDGLMNGKGDEEGAMGE